MFNPTARPPKTPPQHTSDTPSVPVNQVGGPTTAPTAHQLPDPAIERLRAEQDSGTETGVFDTESHDHLALPTRVRQYLAQLPQWRARNRQEQLSNLRLNGVFINEATHRQQRSERQLHGPSTTPRHAGDLALSASEQLREAEEEVRIQAAILHGDIGHRSDFEVIKAPKPIATIPAAGTGRATGEDGPTASSPTTPHRSSSRAPRPLRPHRVFQAPERINETWLVSLLRSGALWATLAVMAIGEYAINQVSMALLGGTPQEINGILFALSVAMLVLAHLAGRHAKEGAARGMGWTRWAPASGAIILLTGVWAFLVMLRFSFLNAPTGTGAFTHPSLLSQLHLPVLLVAAGLFCLTTILFCAAALLVEHAYNPHVGLHRTAKARRNEMLTRVHDLDNTIILAGLDLQRFQNDTATITHMHTEQDHLLTGLFHEKTMVWLGGLAQQHNDPAYTTAIEARARRIDQDPAVHAATTSGHVATATTVREDTQKPPVERPTPGNRAANNHKWWIKTQPAGVNAMSTQQPLNGHHMPGA